MPDAILLIDDQARVVWANTAAVRLFGMSLEESIGLNGLELVHPDDIPIAALSLTSVQGKEVGTPLELRLRTAHGWRLVEMIGAPMDDRIVLSVRDLTERRRWEVAGDEVERFRSLIQTSTTLTMLLSREGLVQNTSGTIARLLGVDQEWLEGRHISCLVHDDDVPALLSALRSVLDDAASLPPPVTVDLRLCHTDGRAVPFALTFTNLLDDPTLEGLVVTGHDISDRVRTEEELRAANSVLAATLESTADGILVVDIAGRITSFNRRFAEMWNLSSEAFHPDDDDHLIGLVLDQLEDPAGFLSRTKELYAVPEAHSHDLFRFKDGRVFERDSLPQRIDGEVVGRVWSFRDVTEHRRLQRELVHQAFHDPLTGLANQALFRNRITHASSRLERGGGRLAVLFIDLDDFKTVNDSLGHSAGDELLVSVGRRLSACVRPGDTPARLGGDEFAVLIEEVPDPQDAVNVAERIIEALGDPVTLSGHRVAAGASIGITFAEPGVDADEVLRNADLAMYTAKSAGKNCYRVFEDSMHLAAIERLDLETHLRGAAGRDELILDYQPIFELATGRIAAMEALVRWNHPERGLLGPLSFIPFAEQGGLIDEIGHHVMARASREACEWSRLVGEQAPAVSVNLSPRQLLDPHLPDRVELLLRHSGLRPGAMILEITEGALMEDPTAAVTILERLSKLGVQLAVDDFGTGYSSLAYLQKFPVDLLKIDGSFVDDSLLSPGWSLAEAIVQISHALGIVAIAEGIESAPQAEALAAFGCDLGQGFHLGRPVGAAEARELIVRSVRALREAPPSDVAPSDVAPSDSPQAFDAARSA